MLLITSCASGVVQLMCCIKSRTERRWLIILSRLAGGPGGLEPGAVPAAAGLWARVGGVVPLELVGVVWLLLEVDVEVLVPEDVVLEAAGPVKSGFISVTQCEYFGLHRDKGFVSVI